MKCLCSHFLGACLCVLPLNTPHVHSFQYKEEAIVKFWVQIMFETKLQWMESLHYIQDIVIVDLV